MQLSKGLALLAAVAACLTAVPAQQASPLAAANQQAQQQPPQQQQQQQQPIPRFRAEANLVRVDAYVTSDGRPVEGLAAADFDVLEDNVRQKVETFEYVRKGEIVAGRAPDEPERRGRLFVLFVDTYHLPWVDRNRLEHRERQNPDWEPPELMFPIVTPPPIPDDGMFRDALKEVVNRALGDDDRVAVLTPDMWAASLTFMEKKAAIEELATRSFTPYTNGQRPPELNHFEACFPNGPNVEKEMRDRYRMYRTFVALQELVANLELVREERKALLMVTRGWDPPPRIHNYRDPRENMLADWTVCHAERLALADRDFDMWLRDIIEEARRSNVAFYSIYAHPLVTFGRSGDIDEDTKQFQRQWGGGDRAIVNGEPLLYDGFPALTHNRNMWHDALKHVAKDTNGRAILTADDFEKGLKDIADSLSSYYLLGYYSTNTKRDGNFRKITVNVKRKGATVRARPGYRAVIPAETEAAELANRPDAVPPEITSALAPLARMRSDVPFHLAASPEWDPSAPGWRVRVVGEIDANRAKDAEWRKGWRADVTVAAANDKAPAAAPMTMSAGQTSFSIALPANGVVAAGEYEVRAKATSAEESVFDARTPLTVPAAIAGGQPMIGRPLLSRRPNTPRSEFQPTADLRFNRREILLLEAPVTSAVDSPTVRIMDRKGQALGSPMAATTADRNGIRLLSATIVLASVAPGDYVLEVAASENSRVTPVHVAFRVVP